MAEYWSQSLLCKRTCNNMLLFVPYLVLLLGLLTGLVVFLGFGLLVYFNNHYVAMLSFIKVFLRATSMESDFV